MVLSCPEAPPPPPQLNSISRSAVRSKQGVALGRTVESVRSFKMRLRLQEQRTALHISQLLLLYFGLKYCGSERISASLPCHPLPVGKTTSPNMVLLYLTLLLLLDPRTTVLCPLTVCSHFFDTATSLPVGKGLRTQVAPSSSLCAFGFSGLNSCPCCGNAVYGLIFT